jgi:hypothetical protein
VQSGVGKLIAPIVQACEEVAGNRGAGLDFQYRKERGSVERRSGPGCGGFGGRPARHTWRRSPEASRRR